MNLYIVIVIVCIVSKDVYGQDGQQNSWLRDLWQGLQQRQEQMPSNVGGSDIGPPLPAFPGSLEGSDIGPPLPAFPGGFDGSEIGPPLPDQPGDMTGTDGLPLIPGSFPSGDLPPELGGGFQTLGAVNPSDVRVVSDTDINTNTGSLSNTDSGSTGNEENPSGRNTDVNTSNRNSNDAAGNSPTVPDSGHHGHSHAHSSPEQCDGRGGVIKDSSGKITHVIDRHDCILLPVIDDPITGGHVFDPHTNEMIFAVESKSLLPNNENSQPIRQTGTSATGSVIRGTPVHRDNAIPVPGSMNAIELDENSGINKAKQQPKPTKPKITTTPKPKTSVMDHEEPTTLSSKEPNSVHKPWIQPEIRPNPTLQATTTIKPTTRTQKPIQNIIPEPKKASSKPKPKPMVRKPKPTPRTPKPSQKTTPKPIITTPKPKPTTKPTTRKPKPIQTKPPCTLGSRHLRRLRILRSRGFQPDWGKNC